VERKFSGKEIESNWFVPDFMLQVLEACFQDPAMVIGEPRKFMEFKPLCIGRGKASAERIIIGID
jgi:hypothetical protein